MSWKSFKNVATDVLALGFLKCYTVE